MSNRHGARYTLLLCGLLGEVLFAGAIFGWNALSLMLKSEKLYDAECDDQLPDTCASQDTKLAVVWTTGVFAVNFGSVLGGPSLDYLGPRVTCAAGALKASVGLLLLSFSFSSPTVLFPLGAFLLSLGGLVFHMSQFHIAQLFPSNKGLVSSLFVGGFIASGFTFEVVRQAYNSADGSEATNHSTYRSIMLVYACLCMPFVPVLMWITPRASLKAGDQVTFQACSFTVSSSGAAAAPASYSPGTPETQTVPKDLHHSSQEVATSPPGDVVSSAGNNKDATSLTEEQRDHRIRRWAALAQKPFKQQMKSPEFFALGLYFSFNVLVLQFYLGTARIQLEEMSSNYKLYVQVLNFIVPGICVLAPFNGFVLDQLGYGVVLIVINTFSLVAVVLQGIPVVQLQVVMFVVWAAARYLLYSSFFTIVGSIFGYQSFGRIFGVISVTAGLLGLLQLPFTSLAVNRLDRSFMSLHVAAGMVVLLLYCPAILMYRWERK